MPSVMIIVWTSIPISHLPLSRGLHWAQWKLREGFSDSSSTSGGLRLLLLCSRGCSITLCPLAAAQSEHVTSHLSSLHWSEMIIFVWSSLWKAALLLLPRPCSLCTIPRPPPRPAPAPIVDRHFLAAWWGEHDYVLWIWITRGSRNTHAAAAGTKYFLFTTAIFSRVIGTFCNFVFKSFSFVPAVPHIQHSMLCFPFVWSKL